MEQVPPAPPLPFRLFHYWRSSSSWRVRWALEIKKVPYEAIPVNLLADDAESPEHQSRNPLGYVPVLEFLDPKAPYHFLAESFAIIEFLNETYPTPNLLPGGIHQRARIRQLSEIINSGTQPLQNPNVAAFHSQDPEEQRKWNGYWISHGLDAYQKLAQETAGSLTFGDEITLADLYLIPQCFNAQRQGVSLDDFPLLKKIYTYARSLDSCQASAPERFEPLTSPKRP